jgi:hypothetical protein
MRNGKILKTAAALATAAAIAATALVPTAIAAPVGTRAAQLETAATLPLVDVQFRRRWWPGIVAGSIIGGAIIASQYPRYYGPYEYDEYEGPPPPGYYQGPPPGPTGPRQCWVEAGPNGVSGYWQPC